MHSLRLCLWIVRHFKDGVLRWWAIYYSQAQSRARSRYTIRTRVHKRLNVHKCSSQWLYIHISYINIYSTYIYYINVEYVKIYVYVYISYKLILFAQIHAQIIPAQHKNAAKQMPSMKWKNSYTSILHPNLLRHPTAAKSWNLNSCSPSCPELVILCTKHTCGDDWLFHCVLLLYFFLAPWRWDVDEKLLLRCVVLQKTPFAKHVQMHHLKLCA